MKMQPGGGQYAESTLIAPFIDARTLDWSNSYMVEYNIDAGPFAERLVTNRDVMDPNTTEASNRRLAQYCDIGNRSF